MTADIDSGTPPAEAAPEALPVEPTVVEIPAEILGGGKKTTKAAKAAAAVEDLGTLTRSETERFEPEPEKLALLDGTLIAIEPLRLRQFLKLLRIITRGGAQVMGTISFSPDMEEGEFVQQLLALVLFSVPEAEDEVIEFLQAVVIPADLTGVVADDAEKRVSLLMALENPEAEDTLIIIQAIIEKEGPDIRALGKRLRAMFAVAQKMGQVK